MTLKDTLRKQMLEIRKGFSHEYCRSADCGIVERLLDMKEYQQADVIFTYVSREGEVDTRKFLESALAQGKTVAVPRCVGKGVMKAYCIGSMDELRIGKYGILEPGDGCLKLNPEKIRFAVIPCVACSENGVRLGYGGGYYDRYLPKTSALKVVLCREKMLMDGIPEEDHDCPIDIFITEERIFTKNPEFHLL